ncbi:MAG: BrnA antitoxin family protein [Rhizobiaceae bacterium]
MSKENIVRYSLEEIRQKLARGEGRSDVKRLAEITDEEIEAQMRDDPDWADFMDIDWSNATIVYPVEKQAVSIRLDRDVLDFFKVQGKGYQTRINAVLRGYVQEMKKLKDPAE